MYRALFKNKKNPNSDLINREEFSEKLEGLFDISVPGVEDRLEMDRLRDEEDLKFLADQRDPELRKMIEGKREVLKKLQAKL